jgi:hypothetical protein
MTNMRDQEVFCNDELISVIAKVINKVPLGKKSIRETIENRIKELEKDKEECLKIKNYYIIAKKWPNMRFIQEKIDQKNIVIQELKDLLIHSI